VLAKSYAQLVESILKRRPSVLNELGAEKEQVGDVVESLWGWVGAYGAGEGGNDEDGQYGEDERDT